MTLSDLFIVCSHGRRSAHSILHVLKNYPPGQKVAVNEWCPGGRPATLTDLVEVLRDLEPFIVAKLGEELPKTPRQRRERWFQRVVEALSKLKMAPAL